MAVSPHNQELDENFKSEEGISTTNSELLRSTDSNSNTNDEECKDPSGSRPTLEVQNNTLNTVKIWEGSEGFCKSYEGNVTP